MTMEDLSIPQACLDCPKLCNMATQLESGDQLKKGLTSLAFDTALPKILAEVLTASDIVSPSEAHEVIDDGLRSMRQIIAEVLDEADRQSERDTIMIKDLTEHCSGSLKMRAATKTGRVITVAVCASEIAPIGRQHETTHVTRD